MSENISSKCFHIFDHRGLFVSLAKRLAQSGARVLYSTPEDRRDLITDVILGDGYTDIECVNDVWEHKKEVDCFVFPDIRHGGMQSELRSQGLPVWGSQRGMILEQDRLFFLEKLKELNLDVPPYSVIEGVTNLALFLKEKKDIWIKVSKWRGSWETFHWRSQKQDGHNIDLWAVKFGGIKDFVRFICFPKIETDLEIGADTYCVDGTWPEQMLHGIERKDAAYFAAVTERSKMPEQLLPVMDAFSPFLKEVGHRNQWSMECRVTDTHSYFIDATTRGGLPSTNSFMAAKNVAEVIYHGARGEFVEIDYGYKFSAEVMVKVSGHARAWETIDLPPELKAELMLQNCCEVKGQTWFPADEEDAITDIGWLRSTGDSPKEVLERMNELADALPDGANADVEALSDVIREIESEQEQGIQFTDAPMPNPNIVLEES